jgi:hypothetical protein
MIKFTRKEYLSSCNERGAFQRYYGEIIHEAGGPEVFANRLPVPLHKIREALAKGDVHLNTISLQSWDMHATPVPAKVSKAMAERGDYPTLAGAVCVLKEAARLLAERGLEGDDNEQR